MSDLITVRAAMGRLGLSRISIYRHIKAGRLMAYKIGHAIRIAPEDLQVFLLAGRIKATKGGGDEQN